MRVFCEMTVISHTASTFPTTLPAMADLIPVNLRLADPVSVSDGQRLPSEYHPAASQCTSLHPKKTGRDLGSHPFLSTGTEVDMAAGVLCSRCVLDRLGKFAPRNTVQNTLVSIQQNRIASGNMISKLTGRSHRTGASIE